MIIILIQNIYDYLINNFLEINLIDWQHFIDNVCNLKCNLNLKQNDFFKNDNLQNNYFKNHLFYQRFHYDRIACKFTYLDYIYYELLEKVLSSKYSNLERCLQHERTLFWLHLRFNDEQIHFFAQKYLYDWHHDTPYLFEYYVTLHKHIFIWRNGGIMGCDDPYDIWQYKIVWVTVWTYISIWFFTSARYTYF